MVTLQAMRSRGISTRTSSTSRGSPLATVQHWTDGEPQGTTVQRIRFDALGEGEPAD
jgi:hypothetical protein